MAWEWSHTEEAYGYAREQLGKLPRETLIEIADEWRIKLSVNGRPPFDAKHVTGMANYGCLADWIWDQASSHEYGRSCSNGGGKLWMCPEGYHAIDLGDMPNDWTPEEY
jgi:hypothetical protein